MKARKKIILICLLMAAAITVSIVGTLAFLTSTDEVVNTFTIGKVKISLDEADVDDYGRMVAGASRVKENNYCLIPGRTYVKDPTVTVKAGSEEAYVRMLVTINKLDVLKEVFGDDFLPQNYVDGTWDSQSWVYESTTVSGNTVVYEFRYYDKVRGADTVDAWDASTDVVLPPLFESFTLPGTVSGSDLELLNEGEQLKITVNAHAIQSLGFGNADEAWDAFDEQVGSYPAAP